MQGALAWPLLDLLKGFRKITKIATWKKAETLFPSRSKLAEYNSIEVRSHKAMLNHFLQWSQGLRTKQYTPEAQPPILCLGTNLRDRLDNAVLDRVKIDIPFPLPHGQQCTGWWSLYAKQLSRLELIAKASLLR